METEQSYETLLALHLLLPLCTYQIKLTRRVSFWEAINHVVLSFEFCHLASKICKTKRRLVVSRT